MKNLLLLFTLILMVGFSSCSDSNELDVSSDDVQLLQIYADEANALINVAGEIDGNVSAIFDINYGTEFNASLCPVTGQYIFNEDGVENEATLLLGEMIDKMGFESAVGIHDWMVEAGRVMYDIKQENKKNFNSDKEMMNELACLVVPEIMTRNSSNACYKENLVALFIGTLEAGSNYGTKLAHQGKRDISEEGCSARGSSFNKIWLFMKSSYDCN